MTKFEVGRFYDYRGKGHCYECLFVGEEIVVLRGTNEFCADADDPYELYEKIPEEC